MPCATRLVSERFCNSPKKVGTTLDLFKKKYRLRREYDASLLALMSKLMRDWEAAKQLEQSSVEKDNYLNAHTKLAEAKFFYLFKEARRRNLKGDLTDKNYL